MIEQIWKKSVHEEVLGSHEHQVLSEHRFALGKDLAGRHICKGDLAVFPEEDGFAPIREVSAVDIAQRTPLLVVSPESVEDIRQYLDLQPLLHTHIAENEEKKINLADEHQDLYIDLMMNLSCSVSQGKCFCSAEDKPIDETNEWYIIENGQTVPLRRGFTLGYSNGQLTLSKVAASKDPNTPELQELAYASLERSIEKEVLATSPKEYQLKHRIIIPAHQRDFAQITELSEDAVQQRLIYRAR